MVVTPKAKNETPAAEASTFDHSIVQHFLGLSCVRLQLGIHLNSSISRKCLRILMESICYRPRMKPSRRLRLRRHPYTEIYPLRAFESFVQKNHVQVSKTCSGSSAVLLLCNSSREPLRKNTSRLQVALRRLAQWLHAYSLFFGGRLMKRFSPAVSIFSRRRLKQKPMRPLLLRQGV